ncbi:MAG: hypothetical protein V7L21_01005 [Nostoc sp.]|nr:hypothetical protein [Nostoc sp. NMS9]
MSKTQLWYSSLENCSDRFCLTEAVLSNAIHLSQNKISFVNW